MAIRPRTLDDCVGGVIDGTRLATEKSLSDLQGKSLGLSSSAVGFSTSPKCSASHVCESCVAPTLLAAVALCAHSSPAEAPHVL